MAGLWPSLECWKFGLESQFSLMSTLKYCCQPLEKSRIPRDVVEIDCDLVIIYGVVDVRRCDGCI
jgi:hypothetical protein